MEVHRILVVLLMHPGEKEARSIDELLRLIKQLSSKESALYISFNFNDKKVTEKILLSNSLGQQQI